jgi:hypothetical protein
MGKFRNGELTGNHTGLSRILGAFALHYGLPSAHKCTSRMPNVQGHHLLLGSAYAQLGQLEEAREETAEVLRINPGFTIERSKPLAVYKNPNDFEHRIDGLRKAGDPGECRIRVIFNGAMVQRSCPQGLRSRGRIT